jgi:hypothetical protein
VKRVAEEELEVAFVRIDPLARDEPDGQRDEGEGEQRRNKPDGAARRRARLGAELSGENVCDE